jgi:Tfp pilus assembly protein PilO
MTKLPKEKRDRLILVCLSTLALLVLIVLGLIIPQNRAIDKIKTDTANAKKTLQDMEDVINKADATASNLHDLTYTLSHAESDMAVGDPNAWIYNTIRNFKGRYKVDISVSGQSAMGNVDLLPKFPYKQLKVTVSGTAYYHDLGKFIADFENTYPHTRVENLTIDPAGGAGDNNEKLTFRMDIIALVKPNETQS